MTASELAFSLAHLRIPTCQVDSHPDLPQLAKSGATNGNNGNHALPRQMMRQFREDLDRQSLWQRLGLAPGMLSVGIPGRQVRRSIDDGGDAGELAKLLRFLSFAPDSTSVHRIFHLSFAAVGRFAAPRKGKSKGKSEPLERVALVLRRWKVHPNVVPRVADGSRCRWHWRKKHTDWDEQENDSDPGRPCESKLRIGEGSSMVNCEPVLSSTWATHGSSSALCSPRLEASTDGMALGSSGMAHGGYVPWHWVARCRPSP